MPQSSTAVKLNTYSGTPLPTTSKPVVKRKSILKLLNLSKFEKCVLVVGSMILFAGALTVVKTKIQLNEQETSLTIAQNAVSAYSDKNQILREEKAELSSRVRLEKYAKSHNLTLRNDQIKNVTEK